METVTTTASTKITDLEKSSWFEEWFDSDYYHILYQERDEEEAKLFLNNLLQKLLVTPKHNILDLACGRGRHANYLAALGYPVTGLDLSPASIDFAKLQAPPNASFAVQDMRLPFGNAMYDVILNLFTSFGYFDNEAENLQVMHHIASALKPGGTAVIEYFNPNHVKKHLIPAEVKIVNNISFVIEKEIKNGFVYKQIQFLHKCQQHSFTERVMLLYKHQFEKYFAACGLYIQNIYGDYALNPYQQDVSPRMILVVKK